jgi:cathepsin L
MVHLRISSLALAILCSLAVSSASEPEQKDEVKASLRSSKANEKYAILSDPNIAPLRSEFHLWADVNSKTYESNEELARRMVVWMDNHAIIEKHNNKKPASSYTLGHNQFSDMTHAEFRELYSLGEFSPTFGTKDKKKEMERAQSKIATKGSQQEIKRSLMAFHDDDAVDLPKQVDWRGKGAVTPIKNQGQCGACWAFSTTGALEGAKFINDGELVSLSEQHLVDCDHKDLGCNGGLMDNAFKFDESISGLCSEEDYPYTASDGVDCLSSECTPVPGTVVKEFVDVPHSPCALKKALSQQPVSIAIQADQMVFQFYRGGVLDDDTCGKNGVIDHGVLAVGYGTDQETQEKYWTVKNSWGDGWGEDGFFRMARNSTNEFGMCSILEMSSYPVVE